MGISTTATVEDERKFRSLFEKYLDSENFDLNEFIMSIPSSLQEALTILSNNSSNSLDKASLMNRRNLKHVVYNFHKRADSLNEKVEEGISLLENDKSKIIVAIHQPNLFAFSGVFKKIILLEVLAKKLSSNYSIVPLFLIVDHDFMDDKWMHTAKLPNIRSSSGVLDLRYPINEYKRWKMSCKTDPPTQSTINNWENQIYKWIRNNKNLLVDEKKILYKNFESFWDLVIESFSTSNNYAEFNSFIISKLVNNIWNYGTLFANLSELSMVFKNGYNFLLSNSNEYSSSLEKSESFFRERGIMTGVSSKSNQNSALWIHCKCGSKGSSKLKDNENGEMFLMGRCMSCKKQLSLRIGNQDKIAIPEDSLNDVSPRAIPILLLLSRELGISGYISGTGGSLGYTIVGKNVFDDLKIELPPMIVWPANDFYHGFAQREAKKYLTDHNVNDLNKFFSDMEQMNEGYRNKIKPLIAKRHQMHQYHDKIEELLKELFSYKQEQRKLKEVHKNITKVKNCLNLKPCIIDYVVNFGPEEISKKWSNSLIENNDFVKPIILN